MKDATPLQYVAAPGYVSVLQDGSSCCLQLSSSDVLSSCEYFAYSEHTEMFVE